MHPPSGSDAIPIGRASVLAGVAEHRDQDVAGAVRDLRVLGEVRRRGDVHRRPARYRTSLSNEPSAARSAESAWSAARRPPSAPCSTDTPPPSSPGCSTFPSMIGTCPATNASVPDTTTGTYEATGTGGARELESLLGDALQDVRVVHGAHPPTNPPAPASRRQIGGGPSLRRLPRRVDAAWPGARSRSDRPRCRGLHGPPSEYSRHSSQDRARAADGLRDRLAGVLLPALLEVARREEVARSPHLGMLRGAASHSSTSRAWSRPEGRPSHVGVGGPYGPFIMSFVSGADGDSRRTAGTQETNGSSG